MKKYDINYELDNKVFNYRVATIIKKEDKILVEKNNRVDHITLPGGRCLLGEDSIKTSIRELKEETGIDAKFIKSLGMIENFFTSSFNGKDYHEILIINEVEFCDNNFYSLEEIKNIEDKNKEHIKFVWMSINELVKNNIKPKVIVEVINNDNFVHIINE